MRIELQESAQGLTAAYQAASPFPHAVIDGLFSEAVLDRALADFPPAADPHWRRFENAQERKQGFDYRTPLGADLQSLMYFLNSAPMLEFLEQLTAIEGLIPDPYFGGAGPHQLQPGGFLKLHADFNWHPKLRLDRRLNLLVYLNRDWHEDYGGHLELWDSEVTRCEQRILPVFNRAVVFSTTDTSFHGNPQPLSCPRGRCRRSLSMYYYTNGRPAAEQSAPHDTIFRKSHEDEW